MRKWLAACLLLLSLTTACSPTEDCGVPTGPPLVVGRPVEVEVRTADGRWQSFETAEGWWRLPGTPPDELADGESLQGTATRIDEESIEVDLGDAGMYVLREFEHLIGCE